MEYYIKLCGHGSGTPSLKNMTDYLKNRYNQTAKNGKHKGVVAVKRNILLSGKESDFSGSYSIILGRNKYSQALREYVFKKYKDGNYYSDCSSSGCACYTAVGASIGMLNTAGMYTSKYCDNVPVNIEDGQITNPDVLKVGDMLLFAGEDASRPLQIGHVEYVYSILKTGWIKSGSKWYYRLDSGANAHGWKLINNHWYYFFEDGEMATGIHSIFGQMYYFEESGTYEGALNRTDENGAMRIWTVST